jgi:hypothetical protein
MNSLRLILIPLAILLVAPASALADETPNPRPGLVLDPTQTWILFIGALVPLVTYVINHHAPWLDEKAKGVVHVITAAIAGGLYQALSGGGIGFNATTLQLVGTSVISALFAHKLLYAPSGINVALGGGSNAPKTTNQAPPQ